MTYKIDEDIPPPKQGIGHISPERKALDKLKPGQSILFPPDRAKTALTAAENKHAKDKSWLHATRKQPDGSRRIWRLT